MREKPLQSPPPLSLTVPRPERVWRPPIVRGCQHPACAVAAFAAGFCEYVKTARAWIEERAGLGSTCPHSLAVGRRSVPVAAVSVRTHPSTRAPVRARAAFFSPSARHADLCGAGAAAMRHD